MIDTIKTVGIVGQGFVGQALKEVFSKYYTIFTYDKYIDKLSSHKSVADLCSACDAIFVCVPTPMRQDGSCDFSIVESVCSLATEAGSDHLIVIKSTIPPGTTKSFNEKFNTKQVVFNPEFLTERFASQDFKNTNRVILGGDTSATTVLKQFYSHVFPNVVVVKTDSCVAEYVKYLSNCFLAVKVSLANEFAAMCQAGGIDYDKVAEYATFDPRLGHTHWVVPGPDAKMGFGGSCFPKDINSMIHFATNMGSPCHTLKGAWQTNLEVRPERDWEDLKGRAVVDE
jgi:nucleotide sugar dehydrogenase